MKLKWRGLTDSQKKALGAAAVSIIVFVAQNATDILKTAQDWGFSAAFVKIVAFIVSLCTTYVMLTSRSVKTSNSGTGSGLIDNGPDERAAQAAQGDAP